MQSQIILSNAIKQIIENNKPNRHQISTRDWTEPNRHQISLSVSCRDATPRHAEEARHSVAGDVAAGRSSSRSSRQAPPLRAPPSTGDHLK